MDANLIIQLLTSACIVWITWKTQKNGKNISDVHLAVNSRLDQLISEIRENVLAQGIRTGRQQVHDEQKDAH